MYMDDKEGNVIEVGRTFSYWNQEYNSTNTKKYWESVWCEIQELEINMPSKETLKEVFK